MSTWIKCSCKKTQPNKKTIIKFPYNSSKNAIFSFCFAKQDARCDLPHSNLPETGLTLLYAIGIASDQCYPSTCPRACFLFSHSNFKRSFDNSCSLYKFKINVPYPFGLHYHCYCVFSCWLHIADCNPKTRYFVDSLS